jgi:hypothetical protein
MFQEKSTKREIGWCPNLPSVRLFPVKLCGCIRMFLSAKDDN